MCHSRYLPLTYKVSCNPHKNILLKIDKRHFLSMDFLFPYQCFLRIYFYIDKIATLNEYFLNSVPKQKTTIGGFKWRVTA